MPKFSISFAAELRAYADFTIEAATLEEAQEKAKRLAEVWPAEEADFTFQPEYDTLAHIEVLDVNEEEPETV